MKSILRAVSTSVLEKTNIMMGIVTNVKYVIPHVELVSMEGKQTA